MSEEILDLPLYFSVRSSEAIRLDVFLLESIADLLGQDAFSRSQLKKWIDDGGVFVNEKRAKPGNKVAFGDEVLVAALPERHVPAPFYFDLDILFEDESILLINKPPGLTVHPGAGNRDKTLLNAVIAYFDSKGVSSNGLNRAGLVHRLDKDTSGLLVLAKTSQAEFSLCRQFEERSISRSYRAICLSTPRATRELDRNESGRIETQIGRHPTQRIKMAVVAEGGKRAITNWKALERAPYASMLEARLETGRTHQIRVHLDSLGSPIIGDPVYGDFSALPKKLKIVADGFGRQALHAKSLAFVHPKSGETMSFDSDPPSDFLALWEVFKDYKGG